MSDWKPKIVQGIEGVKYYLTPELEMYLRDAKPAVLVEDLPVLLKKYGKIVIQTIKADTDGLELYNLEKIMEEFLRGLGLEVKTK